MNCPQCHNPIKARVSTCQHCEYGFSLECTQKMGLYFDLQEQVHRLEKLSNSFHSSLIILTEKMNHYESLLSHELESHFKSIQKEAVPIIAEEKSHKDKEKTDDKPVRESIQKPAVACHVTEPKVKSPPKGLQFEVNMGQKGLLIVGIITMIFGVAYFLKYSFDQGWIGPAGRVSLSYLWGIIFLVGGSQFRKRGFSAYGLPLVGGGIAVLYFSTFASFQIYHLMSQPVSFLVMVVITVFAGFLAVLYDTKWLAVLGIVGGFLTPVLLSTGHDNQIALMIYMTILNLGLLGVAFYKQWDSVNISGFIFTYLLYSGWFIRHYNTHKFWPALIFITVFYLIYAVIPFMYMFFRENLKKHKGFLIITPNTFIAFGFSFYMIEQRYSLEWVSIVTLFYPLIFLAMATYLFKKGKQHVDAFVILLGKSMLFLVITVPIIFSKHWITIFWGAQAVALLWMGSKLNRNSLVYSSFVLMNIAVLKFLIYDYIEIFKVVVDRFYVRRGYTYKMTQRFVTSLSLIIMMFQYSVMLKKTISLKKGVKKIASKLPVLSFTVWIIMVFMIFNVETSSYFHDYLRQARFAAISVLWTLFSVAFMLKGFKDNQTVFRKLSLALFLITLAKVFVIDMSHFSTPYRIISFIIVGVLMVATSFLYYQFKDKIIASVQEKDKGTIYD